MIGQLSIRSLGSEAPSDSTRRINLHGAVITPTGFIADGTIVIVGQRIEAVVQRQDAPTADVDVETGGIISPGFIDTHNHASYAAFARWEEPSRYFRGRFDWRGKTRCQVVVVPEPDPYYATKVSAPYKAITAADAHAKGHLVFFGQVRGIIGGATTMVIDADLNPGSTGTLPGILRTDANWPGRVWGVLDVGCVDEALAKQMAEELVAGKSSLLVHVSEGSDDFSRGEFLSLKLRHLLTARTALIHSMALLESDWQHVKSAGAGVIWSPVSNYRLYGRSIDIGQVLGAGIPVALAPDWTITGSSTVLDEIRFVRSRYPWIGDEQLFAMVTTCPADIMGMPTLGRLAPNAMADVIVFANHGVVDRASAISAVISASHSNLRLAMVGGRAVYGAKDVMAQLPIDDGSEEALSVPSSAGELDRLLRPGAGLSFELAVKSLTYLLRQQELCLAPLWE